MKLLVGLGNPGKQYAKTRHNIGFVILDELKTEMSKFQFSNNKQISNSNFQTQNNDDWNQSKKAKALTFKLKVGEETIELIKPQTFMNESGVSVSYARNKHKIASDDIYVIHDDLDIKLGEYKIQKNKGPKDHNGLSSIYEKLGTRDFWHVRVGVDNRNSGHRISGETYVLQKFLDEEKEIVKKVVAEVSEELMKTLKMRNEG